MSSSAKAAKRVKNSSGTILALVNTFHRNLVEAQLPCMSNLNQTYSWLVQQTSKLNALRQKVLQCPNCKDSTTASTKLDQAALMIRNIGDNAEMLVRVQHKIISLQSSINNSQSKNDKSQSLHSPLLSDKQLSQGNQKSKFIQMYNGLKLQQSNFNDSNYSPIDSQLTRHLNFSQVYRKQSHAADTTVRAPKTFSPQRSIKVRTPFKTTAMGYNESDEILVIQQAYRDQVEILNSKLAALKQENQTLRAFIAQTRPKTQSEAIKGQENIKQLRKANQQLNADWNWLISELRHQKSRLAY